MCVTVQLIDRLGKFLGAVMPMCTFIYMCVYMYIYIRSAIASCYCLDPISVFLDNACPQRAPGRLILASQSMQGSRERTVGVL